MYRIQFAICIFPAAYDYELARLQEKNNIAREIQFLKKLWDEEDVAIAKETAKQTEKRIRANLIASQNDNALGELDIGKHRTLA